MANALYTRKEVAGIFCIRPRTVIKWEKKGIISPTAHFNGRPRYSLDEIERVIKSKHPSITEPSKPAI